MAGWGRIIFGESEFRPSCGVVIDMKRLRWLAAARLSLSAWCVSACCGSSTTETIPPMPTATVVITANTDTDLRLIPAAAGMRPVPVPRGGGSIVLPAGAWRLECSGLDIPPVAVPAFALSPGDLHVVVSPTRAGNEEFAAIPAGPCLIGDRLGVGQPAERPARVVQVPEFQLGRYEVTNEQYAAFLTAVAVDYSAEQLDRWLDLNNRKCRIRRGAQGRFETDAARLPVVTVSWAGANAYCAWRTQRDRGVYRLPTQIEWEKAARGPNSSVYSYGDVYRPNAANQESGRIESVGSHAASPWGLFDLTGNAFEWTADRVAVGSTAEERAVLRGGSFVLDGIFLRNAFRMLLRPTVRADDVGFRVVREVQ